MGTTEPVNGLEWSCPSMEANRLRTPWPQPTECIETGSPHSISRQLISLQNVPSASGLCSHLGATIPHQSPKMAESLWVVLLATDPMVTMPQLLLQVHEDQHSP